MRMKEDHMKNGQLKPAYNWQFSSHNQFIINYTIAQTTTDTTTLIDHLEEHRRMYGEYPREAVADSGYGSEENYDYIEEKGIAGYIKYNYFHKEQSKKFKSDIFKIENLYYNREEDCYYCPMGQKMSYTGSRQRKTTTGYVQKIKEYKPQNCKGCPLRGGCFKAKGVKHRKQRPADVEATFGNIKQNKGFRRFMLRGKRKVEIETGLIAIAHNLSKIGA